MKKNNRWLLYLGIFAVILLVAAAVIRYFTPPVVNIPETKTITTNIDGSQSSIKGVTYTGPEFTPPTELPIQGLVKTTSLESVRNSLISDFSLSSSQTGFWNGVSYDLAVTPPFDEYIFVSKTPLQASSQPIHRDQAQSVAENFVQKYFAPFNLRVIPDKIEALSDPDASDTVAVNSEAASQFLFPFSYSFDGIPLAYGPTAALPVKVVINRNYQIQKASFFGSLYQFSALQKKKIISVETAVAQINQSKAAITQAFQPDFQPIDLSAITSADLKSVDLLYKLDDQSKLAYPFYHFTGTAQNAQGVSLDVEIVTPAVETNAAPQPAKN